MFVCLVLVIIYLSNTDIQCPPLHEAFMDPLYIIYRRSVIVEMLTLFSVLVVFSFWSYETNYIISYSFSLSSFHIVFLCLWCFCAVISLYDANNAFIFSISLVIKKFFHAVYSGLNILKCLTSLENQLFVYRGH